MTCAVAWFEPTTEHYGVAADRQVTGAPFSPLYRANKTAQVLSDDPPLFLALAGDHGRCCHVQRWISRRLVEGGFRKSDDVEQFLLDLHAAAIGGPKTEGLDSDVTGRSGVYVAAAHATGLYRLESYAAVYHYPAHEMGLRPSDRVACVGSAADFVAGVVWGRYQHRPLDEAAARLLVGAAHEHLPHSVGAELNTLTWSAS